MRGGWWEQLRSFSISHRLGSAGLFCKVVNNLISSSNDFKRTLDTLVGKIQEG